MKDENKTKKQIISELEKIRQQAAILEASIVERKRVEEALKESESWLRTILTSAPITIFATDKQGIFTLSEGKGLENVGLKPGENVGVSALELYGEMPFIESTGVAISGQDIVRRALLGETISALNELHGVYFDNHIGPLRDSDGKVVGIVGVTTDITRRKQAEAELKKSEEKYRMLHDSMAQGVVYQDETGKVLSMNPAAESILGMSLEQLADVATINKNLRTIREDGSEYKAEDHPTIVSLRTGKPVKNAVMGIYHPEENDYWWVNINAIPQYKAGQEKPYQVFVTFTDITEYKLIEKMLQASEAHLAEAQHVACIGSWDWQIETNTLHWSDEMHRIFGIDRQQFSDTYEAFLNCVHPDDREFVKKSVYNALYENKSYDIEYRIILPDGSERNIDAQGRVTFDNSHEPIRMIGTVQDITESKKAKEKLRESEEKLRLMFEALPVGITVVDMDGKIVQSNKTTALIYGYHKEEEIVGLSIFEFIAEKDHIRVKEIMEKTLDKGPLGAIELTQLRRDGSEFFTEVNGTVLKDASSNPTGFITITVDITERKRAEEALQESEEKLRLMYDSVTEGITITDLDGIIVDTNEATVYMHGYNSKEQLIGRSAFELIAKRDHSRAIEGLKETLRKGRSGVIEYTLSRKDGSEFPGELSASLIRNKSGNPTSFVAITRNITERKRLGEEQKKVAKLESIGTLAGGIAHDFNNILTAIMGNISLAIRQVEPDSKATERLKEAEKASIRAKDLTQRLLIFATGGVPIKTTILLSELIRETTTFALRGSNVRCNYSLPDNLRPVEADEGQLHQVFTNLVINAIEAMPTGGIIDINARNITIRGKNNLTLPNGNYIELTFADNGIGIPKEHLERIFEPYFTTKQKGSGLGLATSYSIITSHGGNITVESKLGLGTTFHIYLPASKKPVPVKVEIPKQFPITGKGRILVMDDEETIRLLLGKILTGMGYNVAITKDGEEAIKKYNDAIKTGKSFNAVIMDLTIPGGMGGKEAIKKLLEIDPNAKVIVSSGYSTDAIMADYEKYGFSGVVTKPYNVAEIEKTLHGVLKKK